MEELNTSKINKIYIGAISEFLSQTKKKSYGMYDYVNSIIDGKKYGSIEKYADFLSRQIKDRGILSVDEKILSDKEKQTLVTYWIFGRYANATEKNEKIVVNRDGKKERLDFTSGVNEYFDAVKKIFASKELSDERGRKYRGTDFFHPEEISPGKEEINEFILTTLLVSLAVYGACAIATPFIAKKTPGLCSSVREFSEKNPVLTKIGNFLSPFDIDTFVEQDKINKGEVTEEDGEMGDNTEEDDFEAVTQDELNGEAGESGVGDTDLLPPGYEYVKSSTYEQGHDYDENGNYIGK